MKRKGKPSRAALLPEGRAWLLVEFGGEEQKEANDKAEKAFAGLKKLGTHASGMRLIEPVEDQSKIWKIRENGRRGQSYTGRRGFLAVLGGCGGAARAARRLFARFQQAQSALRLYRDLVRPFRRRLRPCPHDLWAEDRRRCRALSRIHAGGIGPLPRLWRVSVRRARRRAGQGRAAAEDVRPRADPGVPRIQVDLGPALADEPGESHRRPPARHQSAARPGLRAAPGRDPFSLSGRPRQLCRRPPSAVLGSANAAASTARRCARASRQPARRCIRPAAARICCSR